MSILTTPGNSRMTLADASLAEVIAAYVGRLSAADRDTGARELNRFGRRFGLEKPLSAIRPIDLERYQEQLAQTGVDARKLEPLRQFLSDAKAKKLIETSLAVHDESGARPFAGSVAARAPDIRDTEAGTPISRLSSSTWSETTRPQIQDDMQRAAADKDMRENAPYHAAKEKLAEVQSRMNMLRNSLSAAEIVETTHTNHIIGMGSTVVVRDVSRTARTTRCPTLVGAGEIDPRRGKISIQSPLGKALADHTVGDMVEVETPSGRHLYRIERIQAS